MLWKKDYETDRKIRQINDVVKRSFSNVKKDTTNIFQWLNFFYKKSMEQDHLIKQLQLELSYIPKTREEIKRIVDDYYSFEGIMGKIRELDYKIDELAKINRQTPVQPQALASKDLQTDIYEMGRRVEKLEQKKSSIKEKIIRRIARNSKEYIKSVIISYIKKYEKISALQLKEMVVDEQNFCSKSSFYRLLEEIEELDDIGVLKHGKEKQYLSKAMKRM